MAFSRIGIIPRLPATRRQSPVKRYEPQPVVGFGNTDTGSDSPVVGIIDTRIRDIYLHPVDDFDPSVLSRKQVCVPRRYKGPSQKSERANIHRSRALGPAHSPLDF